MVKKLSCFFLSFLLIVLLCSTAFISSAVDYGNSISTVELPFPSPSLYPHSSVLVAFDYGNSRYIMIVLTPLQQAVGGGLSFVDAEQNTGVIDLDYPSAEFTVNSNNINCKVYAEGFGTTYQVIVFTWVMNSPEYFVSKYADRTVTTSQDVLSFNPWSTSVSNPIVYGNSRLTYGSGVSSTHNIAYKFVGDFDASELSPLLDELTNIRFYCRDILSALGSGSFQTPPESTTNQTANDYQEAEHALSDDAFNHLNDLDLGDFNATAGTLGNGNAFKFLSAQMEYFTGNKAGSYNSDSDKTLDNPFRKISTVLFIVLSLGLVSFVLNIVSSKGSDD